MRLNRSANLKMYKRQGDEQGAVLMVSMILLVILTTIGINAVDDVSLQTRMAANSQFRHLAFQVAKSELEARAAGYQGEVQSAHQPDIKELQLAIKEGSYRVPNSQEVMIHVAEKEKIHQQVTIDFLGKSDLPPQGFQLGTYNGYRFEINSSATVGETSIGSDQTLGLTVVGAR